LGSAVTNVDLVQARPTGTSDCATPRDQLSADDGVVIPVDPPRLQQASAAGTCPFKSSATPITGALGDVGIPAMISSIHRSTDGARTFMTSSPCP